MEEQELEQEVRDYEVGFLGLAESAAEEIKNFLEGEGARIVSVNKINSITLAYPIGKHRTAFFGSVQFALAPDKIKMISDKLSFLKNMLRFLVVAAPPKKPVPAVREKSGAGGVDLVKRPVEEKKERASKEVLSNEALEQKLEEILR